MKNKAIVLLSGGLDSAVTLFFAKKKGYDCICLAIDYGQRHKKETSYAKRIAREAGARFELLRLKLPWKGSSLTDKKIKIPYDRSPKEIALRGIPATYVPARNTVFLAVAAAFAESEAADAIFVGAHSEDSSGYPDCRLNYLNAFDKVVRLGTKRGLDKRLKLLFPLIDKGKRDIIRLGNSLNVPFRHTWSCYTGAKEPCMRCDSCILRAKGFMEAGIKDPLLEDL